MIDGAELATEQVGHLRHIANLSRQLPNDWSSMSGKATGQDDFGGYRFQLAYMTYALALTHRHRLPAAPGLFKPTIERLVEKMLLPEVWLYWRDTSRGGAAFNAHLPLQEEWDPVGRDNIMYSAYVQSMALLHQYLFGDDRYTEPGALTFRYFSYFWGGPERSFAYDSESLNAHIHQQMADSGYLGVACEPNCVFQICNQPAILGFRLHDLIHGGDTAAEVLRRYEEAWAAKGRLDAGGHYNTFLLWDSQQLIPNGMGAPYPWVDAWLGTLMNMWNREFVHEHYPRQLKDLLVPGPDGTLSVHSHPPPWEVMGGMRADACDFGWTTAWASEMGDAETLSGLLAHAERYMNPTWRDGGLYYPRRDEKTDADGNYTEVEPLTGNALLAYARLNVPDGLWSLFNEPWDPRRFDEPALVEVADDVDVLAARYDAATRTLSFTLRRAAGVAGDGRVVIGRVPGSGVLDGPPSQSEVGPGSVTLRCPPDGTHRYALRLM